MVQTVSNLIRTGTAAAIVDTLLFSPIKFGNVQLKNRICISPMCQYTSDDGFVSDWHLVHLGARAIGGAGLVMMEAAAVEERGRISNKCVGIWKDQHIGPIKRICDFIKSMGSVPAIQLAHSGRKGSTYPPWIGRHAIANEDGGWDTIGASPLAFGNGNDRIPKEATIEDIKTIKSAFVQAARRSIEAGFEVIELHFAHGYLVHSFLSPASNKRTDEYGGTFEGRTRLAIELVREVKESIPKDYPVFVRISATDYLPEGEGWDLKQSIELCKIFKELGVHLVDCSSGGNIANVKQLFIYNNVDQVTNAEIIQKKSQLATGAVGNIISPKWAETILQKNKATLIFIARVSLEDPNWPFHAAFELNAQHQLTLPNQYMWSIGEKTWGNWRQKCLVDKNHKELEQYEDNE